MTPTPLLGEDHAKRANWRVLSCVGVESVPNWGQSRLKKQKYSD